MFLPEMFIGMGIVQKTRFFAFLGDDVKGKMFGIDRDPRLNALDNLGDLAIHLLEPAAPDSFFSWGFFLEALQRVEYVEGYVMEPMAEKMLQEDADLRKQFEELIANDKEFANDPQKRLQWFYEKTPFYDHDWNVYPVAREI